MNARRLRVPKPVKWIVTVILVLAAGALLGGCHKRKVFVLHEAGPYVARRTPRVVLVDRGRDRQHREEVRHERRERPDKRRSDRRQDDRPRPRRR